MSFAFISIKKKQSLQALEVDSSQTDEKLAFSAKGNYQHIESNTHNIFVIGYIQNNSFNESSDKGAYFQASNISKTVKELNGHFSLVLIDKFVDNILIYTNKSGGNRPYLKQTSDGWNISNSLHELLEHKCYLNSEALEEEFFYRWVTGERSLIEGIYQVPSAHYWSLSSFTINKKVCYFSLPRAQPENIITHSIDKSAELTGNTLKSALNSMLKPNKKIAVLLSGGVDSSILSALAQEAGHEIVAISHRCTQHANPELETAIKFAKTLNIEHLIIDIDDSEIANAFKQTTLLIEQAPRFHSSIIIYLLFAKLEGKFSQVIYGEAADTLFGSNSLRRYSNRFSKQQKLRGVSGLIPFLNLIINTFSPRNKIYRLLNDDLIDFIRETNQVNINYNSRSNISKLLNVTDINYSISQTNKSNTISLDDQLLEIKRFAFNTDIDNHFHETCAIATHFGLEIVSPFVDLEIINFAANLSQDDTIRSEFVKPILRKIGEKYFSPEFMYLPKKGFPTPQSEWLEKCLKSQVKVGATQLDFKSDKYIDEETQWTIAALGILISYFNVDGNIVLDKN